MLPDIKRQLNELLSNLGDDDFREVHIDFVKHMGSRSTVLAEFDNHVDLLRETFLNQVYSDTETVLQRGSHDRIKPETSPHSASLADIAAADADDFDPVIHTSDDSAITQRPSLALDPSAEAGKLALDSQHYSLNSGCEHQPKEIKPEKRQIRRAEKCPFTLALQPNRIQDIKNLWALCQYFRGKNPLIESEGKTADNELTRLRRCLEFTEDIVQKSKSAVRTLSLRIYVVQLAIAYQEYKTAAEG